MRTFKEIALEYFDKHPEAKIVVAQKGRILFRKEIEASHWWWYDSKTNDTVCHRCGVSWYGDIDFCSRPLGKWYDQPEVAQNMPTHIKNVLRREEELFQQTIKQSEKIVRERFKTIEEVTGKTLAYLYTTYGCELETVEYVLGGSVSPAVKKEYEACMERESELSRKKLKREIIKAEIFPKL